ncbi:MAG: YqeG family HAD IIIA-type phosphatase [Clostridia bacterium]|nr:YqeG family HAD IIIA-type phosphatase [Clostridia bacterium]
MALLYPTLYRRRITDVTVEDIRRLGAACILLDVDNTLTVHDAPELDPAVKAWLEEMSVAGFGLVIVSNNKPERVAPFAKKIGLPFHALSHKPMPTGFRAAATQMGNTSSACVAIGDQIFTDILGANLAGMSSILLEPISTDGEPPFIVFKRRVERWLLNTCHQKRRRESDYAK